MIAAEEVEELRRAGETVSVPPPTQPPCGTGSRLFVARGGLIDRPVFTSDADIAFRFGSTSAPGAGAAVKTVILTRLHAVASREAPERAASLRRNAVILVTRGRDCSC